MNHLSFKQGEDPYKTMKLGSHQSIQIGVGDIFQSKYNLVYDVLPGSWRKSYPQEDTDIEKHQKGHILLPVTPDRWLLKVDHDEHWEFQKDEIEKLFKKIGSFVYDS